MEVAAPLSEEDSVVAQEAHYRPVALRTITFEALEGEVGQAVPEAVSAILEPQGPRPAGLWGARPTGKAGWGQAFTAAVMGGW